MARRIKEDFNGNWQGYEGHKHVREFGLLKHLAVEWVNEPAVPNHLELLKMVLEHVVACRDCDGKGILRKEPCGNCRGTGKTVKNSLASEIHLIEEAVQRGC